MKHQKGLSKPFCLLSALVQHFSSIGYCIQLVFNVSSYWSFFSPLFFSLLGKTLFNLLQTDQENVSRYYTAFLFLWVIQSLLCLLLDFKTRLLYVAYSLQTGYRISHFSLILPDKLWNSSGRRNIFPCNSFSTSNVSLEILLPQITGENRNNRCEWEGGWSMQKFFFIKISWKGLKISLSWTTRKKIKERGKDQQGFIVLH